MMEIDALHGCGYKPPSPADDVIERGFHAFISAAQPTVCADILRQIKSRREFGPSLFLTEAEFAAEPKHTGVNPRPGRNMLEILDFGLITPRFVLNSLIDLLGSGCKVLDAKLVCGVPKGWVPTWIFDRIIGNPVNNLGAYVKPEYRDMTYFMGIDYHQDIIDWPGRVADFVTVYTYLHDVTETDCPLRIIPDSHKRGAEEFPHDIGFGEQSRALIGPAGSIYIWHPFLLHGTSPSTAYNPRISMRVLVEGDSTRLNCKVWGPISREKTRRDLAADGSAQVKGNRLLVA